MIEEKTNTALDTRGEIVGPIPDESGPPYAFEPGPGQEREDGFCGLAGAQP